MMGPDCGTAIISNVGLAFANAVRKGNIGIVGASGTGDVQARTALFLAGTGPLACRRSTGHAGCYLAVLGPPDGSVGH